MTEAIQDVRRIIKNEAPRRNFQISSKEKQMRWEDRLVFVAIVTAALLMVAFRLGFSDH